QYCDVLIHAWLGVDVSAFANLDILVQGLRLPSLRELVEGVAWEHLAQVGVHKALLWVPLPTEDDPGSVSLRRGVHRQTAQCCQNLSSDEVSLASVEHGLGGVDIVLAVLDNLRDHVLWNWLVPGDLHLHVMDAEFDLPLLQALLDRREVVNIGVRQIVGLSEQHITTVVDDRLREVVQLLVVIPEVPPIQNMVVVSTVVEADELEAHQLLDLLGGWVDHLLDVVGPVILPTDKEEIRVDLNIVEDDLIHLDVLGWNLVRFRGILRLEV